ncbi:uncharacterized protein LOC136030525 [Artemia franciscana]
MVKKRKNQSLNLETQSQSQAMINNQPVNERSTELNPIKSKKKKDYLSVKILTGNAVQGINNKTALLRLNYLYQLQDHIALDSQVLNLAYGKQLTMVKNKSRAMFSPQLRRTICKGCCSKLIQGSTATVKWKTSKRTPKFNRVTCQICQKTQIYPWNPGKKNRIEETIESLQKGKLKKEAEKEETPQIMEKTNVSQLKSNKKPGDNRGFQSSVPTIGSRKPEGGMRVPSSLQKPSVHHWNPNEKIVSNAGFQSQNERGRNIEFASGSRKSEWGKGVPSSFQSPSVQQWNPNEKIVNNTGFQSQNERGRNIGFGSGSRKSEWGTGVPSRFQSPSVQQWNPNEKIVNNTGFQSQNERGRNIGFASGSRKSEWGKGGPSSFQSPSIHQWNPNDQIVNNARFLSENARGGYNPLRGGPRSAFNRGGYQQPREHSRNQYYQGGPQWY